MVLVIMRYLDVLDPSAMNFNPDANVDNGSCDYEIFGCTDPSAMNFNPDATVDNGSCDFEIFGCTSISFKP